MSQRRIKAARIDTKRKHFRSLYREYKDLCLEIKNAPFVKLEKPFIRGYERFFVLKESTLRRRDAKQITEALTFFQNHELCRKGWFRTSGPVHKKWKKGEVGVHHLRRPSLASLMKRTFPSHLLKYVSVRLPGLGYKIPDFHKLNKEQRGRRARFHYPELVVSQTQVRIVTHMKSYDPAIDARIDQLGELIWGNHYRGEIIKAFHYRKWRIEYPSRAECLIMQDSRQQLREVNLDPSIKSAVSPRFFLPI